MTPKTCKVCGRPLPDRTGKPGRPSDFCPPAQGEEASPCARLDKRFQEVAHLAARIMEDTGEAEDARRRLQTLKGYLWSSANVCTNRGRLVGTTAHRYGKKRSGWWRLAPG